MDKKKKVLLLLDKEDFEALVVASTCKGKTVYEFLQSLYQPYIEEAKEKIKTGELNIKHFKPIIDLFVYNL